MKTLHCNHRFTKACYYYQEPVLETELTDEESVTAEEENYNYLKFHSEREKTELTRQQSRHQGSPAARRLWRESQPSRPGFLIFSCQSETWKHDCHCDFLLGKDLIQAP